MVVRLRPICPHDSRHRCPLGRAEGPSRLGDPHPDGENGFSLVELVTVLVIVGVLAAIALPRFVGTTAFTDQASVDRVISAVRYAQEQAMSRNRHVRFHFSGQDYGVEVWDGSNWNAIPVPGTGNATWTLPGDVRFSTSGQREFDGLGRPDPGPCGPGNTIELTSGASLRIECETGFAHAS